MWVQSLALFVCSKPIYETIAAAREIDFQSFRVRYYYLLHASRDSPLRPRRSERSSISSRHASFVSLLIYGGIIGGTRLIYPYRTVIFRSCRSSRKRSVSRLNFHGVPVFFSLSESRFFRDSERTAREQLHIRDEVRG